MIRSLVLLFCSVFFVVSDRVSEQISISLLSTKNECFRILNGTHQAGCQSTQSGNVGVLFVVSSVEDAQIVASDRHGYGSYVVAVHVGHFTRAVAMLLHETDRVVGVVLLKNDSVTDNDQGPFSEDAQCPNNRGSGLYEKGDCSSPWNPSAIMDEGIRFVDWNKPIFLIDNATEYGIIVDSCWQGFNQPLDGKAREYPLCAVEMKLFMLAAKDAITCLRRQTLFYGFSENSVSLCDPLEEQNVFTFIPEMNKAQRPFKNRSVLVLSTRMDSFSMLTDGATGTMSVLPALITVLAVAEAIGNRSRQFIQAAKTSKRSLLIALFHGESLDYIGSSRMLWDMENGRFPVEVDNDLAKEKQMDQLRPEHIGMILDVGQMGMPMSNVYYAHVDATVWNSTIARKETEELFQSMQSAFNPNSLKLSLPIDQLPPSSYQTFLKNTRLIPGMVIADFNRTFRNTHYNSFTDRDPVPSTGAVVKAISDVANAILNTTVQWVTNQSSLSYNINQTYVNELVDCFISANNWQSCSLLKAVMADSREHFDSGKNTYIGGGSGTPSLLRALSHALIVQTMGHWQNITNVVSPNQCDDLNKHQKLYVYVWQRDPVQNKSRCYRTSTFVTMARSPAFEIEGETSGDYSINRLDFDLSNGRYSSWVESVWQNASIRLFLIAPPSYQWILAALACLMLIVSIASVLFIRKYGQMLVQWPLATVDESAIAAPL